MLKLILLNKIYIKVLLLFLIYKVGFGDFIHHATNLEDNDEHDRDSDDGKMNFIDSKIDNK